MKLCADDVDVSAAEQTIVTICQGHSIDRSAVAAFRSQASATIINMTSALAFSHLLQHRPMRDESRYSLVHHVAWHQLRRTNIRVTMVPPYVQTTLLGKWQAVDPEQCLSKPSSARRSKFDRAPTARKIASRWQIS